MSAEAGGADFYGQVARLVRAPELCFSLHALRRSGLYPQTISDPETFVRESWQLADRFYTELSGGRGEVDPVPLLADAGIAVADETPSEIDAHFIHLAVYDPGRRRIELSRSAIRRVEVEIARHGLAWVLCEPDVERIVLLHELFHAFQDRRAELGKIQRPGREIRSRLCEERAAVHFSRLASGLSYSPEVLQVILVHSLDADRAGRMIQDILERG